MAVSKKIVDLTRLALQDRVLTFTERQTIIKTALSEGVPEAEINAFLDNMLAQRLKSLSKEELRNCPACGAQIPLISDECLFCGELLVKSAPNVVHVDISGSEADIIRSENTRVTNEEINLKNCPDCGAPFPLMSNICTHCGHVHHAKSNSEFNVKNLIGNIEFANQRLLDVAPVSFLQVLNGNKGKIAILAVVSFFIANQFYDLTILVLLATIIGGLGLFGITEESLAEEYDEVYFNSLNRFNEYTRLTNVFYGDNSEAKEYLSQFANTIRNAAKIRTARFLKLSLFVILTLLLPFVPLLFILL